jgi:hypothetical protein
MVEYPHLRGQPFTVSEKEQLERHGWPNLVSFFLRLKNGVYHQSYGPSGTTVEEMQRNVVERVLGYAGTELAWADVLDYAYELLATPAEQFKDGVRLYDRPTQGAIFLVKLQDKTDA